MTDAEISLAALDPGYASVEHRLAPRRVPAAGLAAVRRVQRRVARRARLHAAPRRAVREASGHGALPPGPRGPLPPHHRQHARGPARELWRLGRPGPAADHRDRRLAGGADLDRVRDSAGLVLARRRADDRQRSARSRVRRPDPDVKGAEDRPGLPAGADQRHPGAGRRVPRAGRCLSRQGGLRRQHVPLQAGAQEGVLRGAHQLAACRSLFARRERGHPRPHSLDPPGRGRRHGARRPSRRPAGGRARPARSPRPQAERRVRRDRRPARVGSR